MNRKLKLPLLFLLMSVFFSACEKDDICALGTQTTPKLRIDFYEYLNPSVAKNFTKLQIFNPQEPDKILEYTQTSSILLPLRTDATTSSYVFRLFYNSINSEIVNEDLLEIDYSKKDIYISRGCGYIAQFELNPSTVQTPNPRISDHAQDEIWIKEANIKQHLIEKDNETHLDILF